MKEKGCASSSFRGRDAAGKGGTIKAITERVSPRVFRVVALPAPSDREKTRCTSSATSSTFRPRGEIVIFDRSWYNRAGVEYVMGFCTTEQHRRFLEAAPNSRSTSSTGASGSSRSGWRSARRNRNGDSRPASTIRCGSGNSARWSGLVQALVRVLAGPRHDARATDTEHAPWYIVPSDDKSAPGSTASPTSWRRSPTRRSSATRSSCPSDRRRSTTIRRDSPAAVGWSNDTELTLRPALPLRIAVTDERGTMAKMLSAKELHGEDRQGRGRQGVHRR